MNTCILIADDHPQMRNLMRSLCSQVNPDFVFVEASNGEEAIEAYQQHQPDYVIMDIEMPGRDGISATRSICANHPDAQIIIISSHDGPSFRKRSLAAGAISFISKDNLSQVPTLIHLS